MTARAFLEVALDHRCNLRCPGCPTSDDGPSLSTAEAAALLRTTFQKGTRALWFGGGEPTLRPDLPRLVAYAHALGFTNIVVQTNALRLAYPSYREALERAGVTELRVNLKTFRADVHDALVQRPGALSLVLQALEGLTVPVIGDVLLCRSTLDDLPETLRFFNARGVGSFDLWLLSAADDASVAREVPTMEEVARVLGRLPDGVKVRSVHTPPCTLPSALRDLWFPISALGLWVVGPDGRGFALEESRFEGGVFLPGCESCRERPRCTGVRADYLEIHGEGAFVPLR